MIKYQNLDQSDTWFFVGKNDAIIHRDVKDLRGSVLDHNIYIKPTNSPVININDYKDGCFYRDYFIPTGSFVYTEESSFTVLQKTLPIKIYTDQLYRQIHDQIIKIYKKHDIVTLAFSGGIDSMVLLSFVIALGYLSRTDIVCHENHTQGDPDCLHINHAKKRSVDDLLEKFKSQTHSISWHQVNVQDIADLFNNEQMHHVKCYTTATMLKKSDNDAYMFGFHGNQVLLHKFIWLDEMICHDENNRKKIANWLQLHDHYYCSSLSTYDAYKTDVIGIERRFLNIKPWHNLDGWQGRRVYSPLADNAVFLQCRSIDPDTIDVETVANALIARKLIDRNVGSLLDQYITTESLKDGDNLEYAKIPLSLINPNLLTIPKNLCHDQQGLEYIQEEIQLAKSRGHIPFNSLISIKNLQWLSTVL